MIKSAQEAREQLRSLIEKYGDFNFATQKDEAWIAKGYLAGMEDAAVKAVVERIESRVTIGTPDTCCEPDGSPDGGFERCEGCKRDLDALATYRTAIRGRQGE